MKKAKIFTIVLALMMAFSLVACTPKQPVGPVEDPNAITDLNPAEGTVLRMATGYNSKSTGITFDADTAGEGITLADGKTYHTGDLKPTWVELENILKVKFESKYQGNNSTKEWQYWENQLGEVDMVSGTATQLNVAGGQNKVVNIAQYLDVMPNFKAYLEANPIVRLSVTGNTSNGAIYFSPYFDGVNDIERMPLMRVDWLTELLDGQGAYVKEGTRNLAAAKYQPYMPTTGEVKVESLNADGTATQTLTKDYSKYGNIIAKMNAELAKGAVTGEQAVNMLREYIDKTYGGYYGTTRSNLFAGYDACWDADEMVALLRCVVAVKNDVDGNAVAGLFSRETANNQRQVDLFRFAGTLFGVRGLESRQDYLYVNTEGKLVDARQEVATYKAIEKMNAMAEEGLIIMTGTGKSDTYLEKDAGFMSYDYNQTQTVMNATKLDTDAGEKYMAIMVPVAKWNDGAEKYMRFTESWRSVKTDGWAISAEGVEGNKDKLKAALALIDYAYSEEGQILMSYGPKAFIKTKADGSYETFNFNGKQMPVIADATYAELQAKKGGNYTNYARQLLGSTLSFVKSQAFEYQCTHAVGKEGAAKISAAIALGTIKHPELALAQNSWYTSVPTVLPNTTRENTGLAELTNLTSSGKFSQSKGQQNILVDMIASGYNLTDVTTITSAETAVNIVSGTVADSGWGGVTYLKYKNDAWTRLQDYYKGLAK